MAGFVQLQVAGLPLILVLGPVMAALLLGVALLSSGGSSKRLDRRIRQVADRAGGRVEKKASSTIAIKQRRSSGGGLLRRLLPRPDLLRARLARTGKNVTPGQYLQGSAAIMVVSAVAIWLFAIHNVGLAALLGVVLGLALPHLAVARMIRQRRNKFNSLFPDAIDLIVRGLKSGLPVTESMKTVATEIQDPVGTEFAAISDAVHLGTTLEDALWQSAERIDTPEFRFFVVSISVQRETGGNLSETLDNLSDILRKRRQTKMKIRALSAEARASAAIIGVLPFVMFGLMWSVNSGYLEPLINDTRGNLMVLAGLLWLGVGFGVMAKMVRFEV